MQMQEAILIITRLSARYPSLNLSDEGLKDWASELIEFNDPAWVWNHIREWNIARGSDFCLGIDSIVHKLRKQAGRDWRKQQDAIEAEKERLLDLEFPPEKRSENLKRLGNLMSEFPLLEDK